MHPLLLAAALLAQPTQPTTDPAPPEPGFALTIYSTADPASEAWQRIANGGHGGYGPYGYGGQVQLPGYGVVRETRLLSFEEGRNQFDYVGVAAGIDPTTVQFRDFTDPDTRVLEQNFLFDLASFDSVIARYVGEEVMYGGETVTLLNVGGGNVLYKSADGRIRAINTSNFAGNMSLPDVKGLVIKPTLQWDLSTDVAGEHLTQTTYQTGGLTWRADYTIVVNDDDTAVDVGAWVTLMNRSGIDYPDTTLKLIAGDVQRIQPTPQPYETRARQEMLQMAQQADEAGFAERSFFEYHLYSLPRTTTLPDNSTKQIELFPQVQQVPVEKKYVYVGMPPVWHHYGNRPVTDRDLGTPMNTQVDVYLEFANSEEAGMGMPLPTGLIRVYKRDTDDDALEFVGEDVIGHTPREEDVLVKLGSAFDVVGERRVTNFRVDGDNLWETVEVKVRNRKQDGPVEVIIREPMFRAASWEIIEASAEWEKQDARTIHFPVTVAPDEEATVTFEVHYSW